MNAVSTHHHPFPPLQGTGGEKKEEENSQKQQQDEKVHRELRCHPLSPNLQTISDQMVSLEAPTSCQHSAFRWEVHGGSDFETIFPVSFRKKILGNSHHTFPHFFQMNLSHSKSVVSFSKTEGILSEALLSACLLSRLGDVFGAERRCKIMNLHLFCQGCTRKIANKFNLCFTSSPLPPFAISMLIYNRENRCLLQYRLFLR